MELKKNKGVELKYSIGSAAHAWDLQAPSYEEKRRNDPVYMSCIRQVARAIPKRIKTSLDVGCGTGLLTEILSSMSDSVIAVDFSEESLRVLRSKGLKNVTVVQADLTCLPFEDSVFDVCVCANTLQHLTPDGAQQRAVAELGRVTKDNGTLCVSVHHYGRAKRRAGWIKEGKPGQEGIDYIFRFTRSDLRTLIPDSRIRGIGYYGILRVPLLGGMLQDAFAKIVGRIAPLLGFGHMLMAVSKKRTLSHQNR